MIMWVDDLTDVINAIIIIVIKFIGRHTNSFI